MMDQRARGGLMLYRVTVAGLGLGLVGLDQLAYPAIHSYDTGGGQNQTPDLRGARDDSWDPSAGSETRLTCVAVRSDTLYCTYV